MILILIGTVTFLLSLLTTGCLIQRLKHNLREVRKKRSLLNQPTQPHAFVLKSKNQTKTPSRGLKLCLINN